jgi:hypothetical protein
VKPANVLLARDGNPILADFGLAKLLQSASVKTMSGVTTGTPAYMAPEQVVGGVIGPAADRYALATIAYEVLTGRVPFEGDSVLELLYAHVHREPPAASIQRPDLGLQVDAVLARGLRKDAGQRWESCAAMVDALETALKARAEKRASGQPRAAMAGTPMPGSARRSRTALLAAIGAALIAFLVLATVAVVALHASAGPTLTGGVSSSTVRPGQSVVVTAQGLPPGQAGVIRLANPVRDLAQFHADATGGVVQGVHVPLDESAGDHPVQLCWSARCHDLVTITVTRGGA